MLSAGKLDKLVQFLERPSDGAAGFGSVGDPRWGSFTPQVNPLRLSLGGLWADVPAGTLLVRLDEVSRAISTANRVTIDGDEYQIRSTSLPDRRSGTVSLNVSGSESRDLYDRVLSQQGERVILRRIVPNAPAIEAHVRAVITGYAPNELVNGIQQGDQRAIISASDVAADTGVESIRQGDKIVYLGRVLNVQYLYARRIAGVTIAYDVTLRG